jgi:hypothetical protein
VVVVVGVFIGLQASNWNADRQTDAKAAVFTERLRADLREEAWAYEYGIGYGNEVLANARRAADALSGKKISGGVASYATRRILEPGTRHGRVIRAAADFPCFGVGFRKRPDHRAQRIAVYQLDVAQLASRFAGIGGELTAGD